MKTKILTKEPKTKDLEILSKKMISPMPILELCSQAELSMEELEALSGAITSALQRLDDESMEISTTRGNLENNYRRVKVEYKGTTQLDEMADTYAVNSVRLQNMGNQCSQDRQVFVKVQNRIKYILK